MDPRVALEHLARLAIAMEVSVESLETWGTLVHRVQLEHVAFLVERASQEAPLEELVKLEMLGIQDFQGETEKQVKMANRDTKEHLAKMEFEEILATQATDLRGQQEIKDLLADLAQQGKMAIPEGLDLLAHKDLTARTEFLEGPALMGRRVYPGMEERMEFPEPQLVSQVRQETRGAMVYLDIQVTVEPQARMVPQEKLEPQEELEYLEVLVQMATLVIVTVVIKESLGFLEYPAKMGPVLTVKTYLVHQAQLGHLERFTGTLEQRD